MFIIKKYSTKITVACCLSLFVIVSLISGCGSAQKTIPLTDKDNLELERGSISVHPTIMKEFTTGNERIKFGDLLNVSNVFTQIPSSFYPLQNIFCPIIE